VCFCFYIKSINSICFSWLHILLYSISRSFVIIEQTFKEHCQLLRKVKFEMLTIIIINLTDEKDQLQRDFDSLNKKGPVCFFKSTELKSWSDSRQYCRDRGADLVIINTEEKQVSLFSERVWIGLSDTENEGIMKWVDNSRLKQGFWHNGEPNNQDGNEDCIELMPSNPVLNNWNDLPCSQEKKGFCEK
uniref:Si:ch73-343l4.8 n=1 Tax=Sinocyclocheilus rhinocerous TaxID=307959 RepID=A0A673L0Q7_9TELE